MRPQLRARLAFCGKIAPGRVWRDSRLPGQFLRVTVRDPMNSLVRTALLLVSLVAAGALHAKDQEESIFLFQNRKVSIVVPDGLGFASSKDERGLMIVQLADPKDKVSMAMTFLPDPTGTYANARSRKELMDESFRQYVEGSVEKTMQFEELEPKMGAGTYCVFTDASLVGKTKLPPHEYLNSTTGVKSWPGVVVVFSLFSNGTASKEYKAVMKMLRESVHENPVPLR